MKEKEEEKVCQKEEGPSCLEGQNDYASSSSSSVDEFASSGQTESEKDDSIKKIPHRKTADRDLVPPPVKPREKKATAKLEQKQHKESIKNLSAVQQRKEILKKAQSIHFMEGDLEEIKLSKEE